jgi:hypothetical protein
VNDDTRFWPGMVLLADCLCQQITDSGLPPVCFCGIIPGDAVILDYCTSCDGDACGMAWVRLVSAGPLIGSPMAVGAANTGVNTCATLLVATIEVGIARCAPMPDDDGAPPTMADQLAAAELHAADMAAVMRAIVCCPGLDQRNMLLLDWAPIGPEGGCLGGRWQVMVGEAVA